MTVPGLDEPWSGVEMVSEERRGFRACDGLLQDAGVTRRDIVNQKVIPARYAGWDEEF